MKASSFHGKGDAKVLLRGLFHSQVGTKVVISHHTSIMILMASLTKFPVKQTNLNNFYALGTSNCMANKDSL